MEKRKVLNYVLAVDGIYGRNRTVKFSTYQLFRGVDPATPKTMAELLPLMRAKLAEHKYKVGAKVRLTEDPIETDGRFETFVLMSETTLLRGVLGNNGDIIDPRESELLKFVPDDVWNLIMAGKRIEAVHRLQYAKGLGLRQADIMTKACMDVLGLPY